MKIKHFLLILMVLVGSLTLGCMQSTQAPDESTQMPSELTLATTTSTYDSGLLDVLNPVFEEKYNVRVKVIAVGTGAALRHGQDGDVDVVLVHARAKEDQFVADGYGVNRQDVMYNDFVIIGPSDDPAGIKGMDSASDAFNQIATSGSIFVSRADNSGTHTKEKAIWEEANTSPAGEWYLQTGKGMGDTITHADQVEAYTLSDRGTYIKMRDKIGLEVLVEGPVKGGDPILMNPYGVIAVNPDVHPDVEYDLAMSYIEFLTSEEGQKIIAEYTIDDEPCFYPSAQTATE